MTPTEIFLSQVEHTADLAHSDGPEVTASKLRSHVRQFREATEGEGADYGTGEKPPCERCGGSEEVLVTELSNDDDGPERTFREACPDCSAEKPVGDEENCQCHHRPGKHRCEACPKAGMKLKIGDGGEPAGMNDAIYAAEQRFGEKPVESGEGPGDYFRGHLRVIARGDMPSTGPTCNSRQDLEIALMLWAEQVLSSEPVETQEAEVGDRG